MKSLFLLFLLIPTLSYAEKPKDNPELIALEEADQADRAGGPTKIDWSQVTPRDHARRNKTLEILGRGDVKTARDYYNAAMIFQHSDDKEDIRIALAFATLSRTLAPDRLGPKSLQAASWDRYLVRMGQPQWYGTQYQLDKAGKESLNPVNESVISDKERQELGLPTLEEAKKLAH